MVGTSHIKAAAVQLIRPYLIGPKGLMRRSKLGAVDDAANAGSDKVFVRDTGHGIGAP